MARFFINRPIVAMVISIVIVLLGLVSLQKLPISQYPEITPPEVLVEATYTGADAVAVEQSVATPIEQQVNGVENMIYMKSTNSNDGRMQLRVAFEVGSDLDMSNVLVQNRVSQATPLLPEDVKRLGVNIKKSLSFPLLVLSLHSPQGTYDSYFLSNYASININDVLSRIRGVGQVNLFGGSDYAMRIWVKPDRLAELGLTVGDLSRAVQQQNVIAAGGQIGSEPSPPATDFTYSVRTKGRLESPEEFGQVIVRSNPDGSQVRLADVARIELGSMSYIMKGRLDGKPAAVIAVYQTPGSNALQVAGAIKSAMAELAGRFPPDLEYEISLDTTLAVEEGIKEIEHTLFEAVGLVILVVFIFLQNWRATLIPLLTVPVSLIGAFIAFPMLGFSVNVLSLLGLVLAIGIVVDDAIVVVEAVMHHVEHGMTPREATLKAMQEVSGPVVAIALILTAVFVPVAFMGGITGRLYQQFAITIALSVLLSAFNALTLSPALAGLMLRPPTGKGLLQPFYRAFNRMFARVTDSYIAFVRYLLGRLTRSLLFVAGLIAAVVLLMLALPQGFVPEEDQGYLMVHVQLPDAASLPRTDEVCRKAESILGATKGVDGYVTVVGYSLMSGAAATNTALFFVGLSEWSQRGKSEHSTALIQRLNRQFAARIPEAAILAFGPPAIPGLGTGAGFSMMLQDRTGGTPAYLQEQARAFLLAANQRPEIARAFMTYSALVPQLYADIDREKALKLGVSLSDLNSTLGASLGGAYVNDFNRFGRLYKVYVQAEPEYRGRPDDIGQFYVRSSEGKMVSLSTLLRTQSTSGPAYTYRFNLFRSAEITGAPAEGYSSTQALAALEQVAQQVLPPGITYEWNAMSYQEKKAAGTGSIVFVFALLMVFLILAAQYESWSLPFSVLLGTPFAAFGAFLGIWLARFASASYVNNVFAQIGLVMLIGLAAKNAILIVEFARMKFHAGTPLVEATLEAAKLRFRPILMTAFAFILGVSPLVTASGAGAEGRKVMGMAVFAGMLVATLLGVFLIPVLYVTVEKLSGGERKLRAQPAVAVTLLAGILLLTGMGCAVGPSYVRPAVQAPAAYLQPTPAGESVANLAWWELFGDPQLQQLVHTALEHNLDLQTAFWRVEEARATYGFTRADLFPALRYQADAQRADPSDIPVPALGAIRNDFFLGGGVVWEVDLWGRLRRATEAARADLLAKQENQRAVTIALVAETARLYTALLDLDERLAVAQRTLSGRRESTQLIRSRFDGGIVPELDLRQAEIQEETAAAAVATFERGVAQTENALCVLLGRNPGAVPAQRARDMALLPPEVPAGLPSELLQRRPDILQAEHLLHAQTARIGVAQALRFPSLDLTGAGGKESDELDNLLESDASLWSIGGSLAGPLFQFGKNVRRVQVEKARTEQALRAYEKSVLVAFEEVEDALIAVRTYREESAARRRQVDAARAAATLSRARYEGGVTSYLEVLDTERTLFQAELDASAAEQSHRAAVIQLYKALGGGWSPPAGSKD